MSNDERIAVLETTVINMNSNLTEIKQDIRRLSDRMDSKFEVVDNKIDSTNKWLIGLSVPIFLAIFSALLAILLKLYH